MKKILFAAVILAAALTSCFSQELVKKADALSANDEKFQGKAPIKWYAVTVKADMRLAIRAASVDFTPRIVVSTGYGEDLVSDGSGGSASFSYTSEAESKVKVGVTTASGQTGAFLIRVALAPASVAIKAGDRVTSELAWDDDVLEDGYRVKWFSMPVKKGQRLAVASWADSFDPTLVVTLPGGMEIESEESASLHSVARLTAPKDGELKIGVSTADEEAMGAFTLQVLAAKDAKAINPGDSLTGSLKDGDDMLAGKPMDAYRLHGKAGTRYIITLASEAFDTSLYIQDSSGRVQSNDDTSEDVTDSMISYTFTDEGDLEIRAYALDESDRGSYTISVKDAPPPQTIRKNQVVRGTLNAGDDVVDGKYMDRYLYNGKSGETVSIDLKSEDIDSYLIVMGPSGDSDENDDFEDETTDSYVSYTFTKDGILEIQATSLDEDESGDYTLVVGPARDQDVEEYDD